MLSNDEPLKVDYGAPKSHHSKGLSKKRKNGRKLIAPDIDMTYRLCNSVRFLKTHGDW
ncbi:hypothetical protein TanjilG_11408 [Lupinus angustifolius]|uniref:Uncharacterized protein n=1 Tax=Lupinus angustifolius TaxID=3871 RepID=A0A1J7HMH9_LUPAN|nr:hypothetical protein TanjilG_11408 [Lupinus angustifolius]